jgi:hypothetical protein
MPLRDSSSTPPRNFDAYPYPWSDTSGYGTYQPNILSVSDGNLRIHLHTNARGEHLVAAPEPKINDGHGGCTQSVDRSSGSGAGTLDNRLSGRAALGVAMVSLLGVILLLAIGLPTIWVLRTIPTG